MPAHSVACWVQMPTRPDRRLAAVMALDVVGYTRLMGRNEEETHNRVLGTLYDLVAPTVASCGGRVVKKTGDGALAEFRSVVEAVRCGIIVQCAMRERK